MRARVVYFFFVFIVAANIPFWIASDSMGFLLPGLFNVELAIVGVLSLFVRRAVTVTLLLIAMLMDVLRGVNSTYVLGPFEMVRSARYLFEYAPAHSGGLVAVGICVAVVCLMGALVEDDRQSNRERVYIASALAAFLVLCGAVDVFTGHTSTFRGDCELGTVRLTRFPAHSLVMSELQYRSFNRLHSAGANAYVPAASKVMVRFDEASAAGRTKAMAPNVVLILVESWGKPLAADLEGPLVRPYTDSGLSERYTVSRGTVPFYGPTVAGEARELCGSAMGFGLLTASGRELKRCLPETMKAMGYHSTAVHGYSARMFDRGEWYVRMGFDETWFREQLQGQGLPMCPGPFPGTCDAAASEWIGDRLQRDADSPQFIYWVTLNSHLPVPVSNGVKDPPTCSGNSITGASPALCAWYQLVFNVHRSVSELALRSTPRPTIFLIVGDHAPPFSSARLRRQFSDRVVPYLLLVPKSNGTTEGPAATGSLAVAGRPNGGVRKPHLSKGAAFSSSAAGG